MISVELPLVLVVAAEGDRVLCILRRTRVPACRLPWRVPCVLLGAVLRFVVVVTPVEALAVVVDHVGGVERGMIVTEEGVRVDDDVRSMRRAGSRQWNQAPPEVLNPRRWAPECWTCAALRVSLCPTLHSLVLTCSCCQSFALFILAETPALYLWSTSSDCFDTLLSRKTLRLRIRDEMDSILPVTSPTPGNGGQYRTSSGSSRIPMIFRRLHRFHQMVRCTTTLLRDARKRREVEVGLRAGSVAVDIPMSCPEEGVSISLTVRVSHADMCVDTATSTSTNVCGAELSASRRIECKTETKNTWARDDPAILILIAACLCGASYSESRFRIMVSCKQPRTVRSICCRVVGCLLVQYLGSH